MLRSLNWASAKKTKFERLLCQGDKEGRGSTGWSRGTDKHAPMHSILQVVANPCSLAVAFFYRRLFRSHIGPTCGIDSYVWNLEKYFNRQAALCPRLWGVRQPAHWSGIKVFFSFPEQTTFWRCVIEACWQPSCARPTRAKRAGRWLHQGGGEQSTSDSRSLVRPNYCPTTWEEAMFVFGTGDGREKKAKRARDWTPEDNEFLGVIFVLDIPLP